jgi:hypothetical protein
MNDGKLGLGNLSAVPIIGMKLDDKGIAMVEEVLALMKRGEILSVAIVAEAKNGDMRMNHSIGLGQVMRMRAGLATLGTALDLGIIGVVPG